MASRERAAAGRGRVRHDDTVRTTEPSSSLDKTRMGANVERLI